MCQTVLNYIKVNDGIVYLLLTLKYQSLSCISKNYNLIFMNTSTFFSIVLDNVLSHKTDQSKSVVRLYTQIFDSLNKILISIKF